MILSCWVIGGVDHSGLTALKFDSVPRLCWSSTSPSALEAKGRNFLLKRLLRFGVFFMHSVNRPRYGIGRRQCLTHARTHAIQNFSTDIPPAALAEFISSVTLLTRESSCVGFFVISTKEMYRKCFRHLCRVRCPC